MPSNKDRISVLVDDALCQLVTKGAKRVDISYPYGCSISAYWVGKAVRLDIFGVEADHA